MRDGGGCRREGVPGAEKATNTAAQQEGGLQDAVVRTGEKGSDEEAMATGVER